jgi:prevent-host-death family protein
MKTLDTSVARRDFASVVDSASKGERFILRRHGRNVAAVVPVRDLAMLRAIEDRLDAEAADAALKDIEAKGTVPWETLKAKLGLSHGGRS